MWIRIDHWVDTKGETTTPKNPITPDDINRVAWESWRIKEVRAEEEAQRRIDNLPKDLKDIAEWYINKWLEATEAELEVLAARDLSKLTGKDKEFAAKLLSNKVPHSITLEEVNARIALGWIEDKYKEYAINAIANYPNQEFDWSNSRWALAQAQSLQYIEQRLPTIFRSYVEELIEKWRTPYAALWEVSINLKTWEKLSNIVNELLRIFDQNEVRKAITIIWQNQTDKNLWNRILNGDIKDWDRIKIPFNEFIWNYHNRLKD